MCKQLDKEVVNYRLANKEEPLAETFYALSEESYVYGSPWTVTQYKDTLNQEHLIYFVAEKHEKILGFVAASLLQKDSEIYNVVVSESHKRQGIGSGLIQKVKRVLKEHDIRNLYLEVRMSNEPAIELYKTLDFQPIGVRPDYYSKPSEGAIILKCTV